MITNANKIQELNLQYRDKNKTTDVLSFPQIEWEYPCAVGVLSKESSSLKIPQNTLGDLVISLEQTEHNAQNIGQSINREFCFLLVHGILHLCGHDHIELEDEKIMLNQQRLIMDILEKHLDSHNGIPSLIELQKVKGTSR